MGSNATYQCRDGSSDVYTTQCTSDGVWEPNPNATLDCTIPGIIKGIYDVNLIASFLYHSMCVFIMLCLALSSYHGVYMFRTISSPSQCCVKLFNPLKIS